MTFDDVNQILAEAERLTVELWSVDHDRIGGVKRNAGEHATVRAEVWLAMRAMTIGIGIHIEREWKRAVKTNGEISHGGK